MESSIILAVLLAYGAVICCLNRARPLLTYVSQFVHESGHYLALRLFGVYPLEFKIGDTRLMCRMTIQTTIFSFHLNTNKSTVVVSGDDIRGLSWWQRLVVYAAGAAFNLAFGFAAVMLVIWYFGFANTALEIVTGFALLYLVLELLGVTSLICFDCLRQTSPDGQQTDGYAIREILEKRFGQ